MKLNKFYALTLVSLLAVCALSASGSLSETVKGGGKVYTSIEESLNSGVNPTVVKNMVLKAGEPTSDSTTPLTH